MSRTNGSILSYRKRTIISRNIGVPGHGRLRLGRGLRILAGYMPGVFIEV